MELSNLTTLSTFAAKISAEFKNNDFTQNQIKEFFDTANNQDDDLTTLDEAELKQAMQTVKTKYEAIKNLKKPSLKLEQKEDMTENEIYGNINKINNSINEKKSIVIDFLAKDGTGSLDYYKRQGNLNIGGSPEDLNQYIDELKQFCNNTPEIGDRVKASGIFDLLESIKILTEDRSKWYNKLPED